MAYWNIEPSWEQDKAIVGSVEKTESTTSVNISATNVGTNSKGDKHVPAGLWLAKVNGVNRFLPRDVVGEDAVTTGSPNIPVSMPEVFLAGDKIYHLEPVATLTFGGTYAAPDTVTINLGSRSFTTAVGSATLATVITNVAAAINASHLKDFYRAQATSGTVLSIYSAGSVPTISVSKVSDSGTIVVTTQFNAAPTFLGTVSSVDYENSTVVLGANSAAAVAAGGRIGTLFDEVYGIHLHSIDFSNRPSVDINAVHGASKVYRQALPYTDKALEAMFPKLVIN